MEQEQVQIDQNTMCFAKFDNSVISDSSSSSKTITVYNGANRSQSHKGIAPLVLHNLQVGKRTGTSGVYFDGSSDYLELGAASVL